MAFDKETAKMAGQKSKRRQDTQLKALRSLFSEVIDTNKSKIQGWIDEVGKDDPAKALEILLKFSSFIIPKPKTIEIIEPKNSEPDEIKIVIVNSRDELKRLEKQRA